MRTAFISWLPLAVVVTLMCGLVYATVQQNYRLSLNDPQVQMAGDVARQFQNGIVPASLTSVQKVDIIRSLSPYVVIYDENLRPVAGSGELDGLVPMPPLGVFETARINGENRLTWQPRPDVRSAIDVVHVGGGKGGFVLSGRNMREVESREAKLFATISFAWLVTLLISFMVQLFAVRVRGQ